MKKESGSDMSNRRRKAYNKGFSLVELLVAAALLFILAAGFIPLLTNSYVNIFFAGERNISENLARGEVEQLLSAGTHDGFDILTINFVDATNMTAIEIRGRKIIVEKGTGNKRVTYSAFIPNSH